MTRVSWVRILGGVLIVVVSAMFLVLSLQYGMGTLMRMRAGYFPVILSVAGVLIGAFLLVGAVVKGGFDEALPAVPIRPLVCTLLAIACFAMLIRSWGLLPAVAASTIISALGYRDNSVLGLVLITLGAAVFSWTVFILALDLPLPLIRGVL